MLISMSGAKAVQRVVDGGQSLDKALEHEETRFEGSRSALKELSFGACRHYIFLDGILSKLLSSPIKQKDRIVHFLMISGLYQIEFMGIPDHAVVNETVSSLNKTRQSWAKKLVNGVLRNFIRNRTNLIESIDVEHVAVGFPAHLYDLIQQDWPNRINEIVSASNQKPPLTLRVNLGMNSRLEYESILQDAKIGYAKTTQSEIGIILDTPTSVNAIPGFADGRVSVQDESAQLISTIFPVTCGRVLDGCAAPGGKTCLILEAEPGLEDMVAVDLPERIESIRDNLQRLKLNAKVIGADIRESESWWDGKLFDGVLLDVPCSGSGVIRRHPDIKHRRLGKDIGQFADQQWQILDAVWPLLAVGGDLLYVTCSILRQENDDVIGKFINGKDDYELQSLGENIGITTQFGVQRLPGVHEGDGFYYSRIKKV